MPINILAIDTAGESCSVCLSVAGQTFFQQESTSRNHSRYILDLVDRVFRASGQGIATLDLLAWSAGPGSFTGLRIGASVVQALSYAHRLPVLPLSTLEVYACAAVVQAADIRSHDEVWIAMDARMNGIYSAEFGFANGNLERRSPDQLLPTSELTHRTRYAEKEGVLFAGDGWSVLPEALGGKCSVQVTPSARDVVLLAGKKARAEWVARPADCLPQYVHDGQLWQKRRPRGVS